MTTPENQRPLEAGITTDFRNQLSYGKYLHLDTLLSAQHPLSAQHDEMLFIVQHHVAELWLKLTLHELRAVLAHLREDKLAPCFKMFSRIKLIQQQLIGMWSVLETLTPTDYLAFRDILGPSSGFQSLQYRLVEFALGNKNADMLVAFAHDAPAQAQLRAALEAPSLYDECLGWLARCGHAVPASLLQRDFARAHVREPALVPVLVRIYENTEQFWDAYDLCESLVDIEVNFQTWRFRHMKTVERIIGYRRGTGGSSGVGFLKQALDLTFFPELFEARTCIGVSAPK
ncbi:MAG: tryptophan 2,3-dioxygenase [Proteobacteria bacterium]|nr:tryptophan 2,3-dioxygenase [Pseudomonadota bacterium]